MENFIYTQYGERHTILNIENIKICEWTTKLEVIKKCNLFVCSSTYAENLIF